MAATGMVLMGMAVIVVAMSMVVTIIGARPGGVLVAMGDEGGPYEIHPHDSDHRKTCAFKQAGRAPRRCHSTGEGEKNDRYDHDGGKGLHDAAHERNQHAALELALGGEQPRRNHGLAMAWACRMKDAIGETQKDKGPGCSS